ncbi:uncharacterized protein [Typha latifolia]|uniref:uncharacterized protein n=1 Tax=Typha latifolia TaxID=4733 RepID=UPI003C2BB59D
MGISLVSFYDSLIRRSFVSAGLRPETLNLDSETTIQCWISESLSVSSPNPKPILLLIHGFGPTATWQWRSQVGPLARHFDLIVPDLLFFGGSTTASPLRSEVFQAAAVVRLLDALLAGGCGGGDRRVALAGTSYGGFVAYHVASLLGEERVGRVVIASSDLMKGEEDDKALAKRSGVKDVVEVMIPQSTAEARTLVKMATYRSPRFVPEFLLRDLIKNYFSDNVEEKKELIKGITIGNKDKFQLTPLPQDVLIVWGEHDQIFPLDKAFKMKKQLGDKARLEVIENTGHTPQLEDPNRFNEILLDFLLGAESPRCN